MSSRKRQAGSYGDELTGGTKDVNPQFLSGAVTLSAANTLTEVTLGTPIVRVGPQTSGQSIIMEILKIFVELPFLTNITAASVVHQFTISFATAARGTGTIALLSDPLVLAQVQKAVTAAFSAGGTGITDIGQDPIVVDLTDGAGHGVLVATDNLFIQAVTSAQGGADTFRFKILYRFKKVSLVEYIGIVQSQQ